VKDVLAHLMTGDEETARRFRLIARGRGDRIRWFESMVDADRFNARSVAAARRLSLRAVLRRMERAHGAVLESFRRLPPESVRDPSHAYPVTEWLPARAPAPRRDQGLVATPGRDTAPRPIG